MITDTEALREQFEQYVNPDGDVNLRWLAAGFYAVTRVQESWLDFKAGYQAGHAAAKAETADVGEPVGRLVYTSLCPSGEKTPHLASPEYQGGEPLYTADQLAAAMANERERCAMICEELESNYWREYKARPERSSQYNNGLSDGAGECAIAIRTGDAKEPSDAA